MPFATRLATECDIAQASAVNILEVSVTVSGQHVLHLPVSGFGCKLGLEGRWASNSVPLPCRGRGIGRSLGVILAACTISRRCSREDIG